jgi:hypothetical protein
MGVVYIKSNLFLSLHTHTTLGGGCSTTLWLQCKAIHAALLPKPIRPCNHETCVAWSRQDKVAFLLIFCAARCNDTTNSGAEQHVRNNSVTQEAF